MKRLVIATLFIAAPAFAAPAPPPDGSGDNTPPEGFIALFNGKNLDGWQGHITMKEREAVTGDALGTLKMQRNQLMKETWTVKDGVIHHVPKVDDKGRKSGVSLQTTKDYGDFEWHVSWKIEKGGDSGLYLRGQPQVQIWDSDNLAPGLKDDWGTGSGGLWNNPLPKGVDPKSIGKTPLVKADKPVGEWNTFKITMKGDKVTIYLNDKLVIDKAALAPYKSFNDKMPEKGPLELQYHGDKLWFKNIYVKELK
jgi:hypothetical protein